MSVCEGRKQVYNPAGIMQTAGKRSADSGITLATVARADCCVSAGRKRKGERAACTFRPISRGLGHILGCPKVAYSVNPGDIEIARLEVRAGERKWCRVDSPRRWIRAPRMVFVSVTFVPRGN